MMVGAPIRCRPQNQPAISALATDKQQRPRRPPLEPQKHGLACEMADPPPALTASAFIPNKVRKHLGGLKTVLIRDCFPRRVFRDAGGLGGTEKLESEGHCDDEVLVRLETAPPAPSNEYQTNLCRSGWSTPAELIRQQRTVNERTKMKRKNVILQKTEIHLDPRYASARPWDWRVCLTCEALIPHRCPRCGSDKLSDKPRDVIHAALTQFGPPPSLLKG